VERANNLIFEAIKKILKGEKRKMSRSHAESGVEAQYNSL
jgi:hypothetical protein